MPDGIHIQSELGAFMKVFGRALLFAGFLLCASSLHAQTGCEDSPEAPTAILALVGGASFLAMRYRSSRRK
jgi:XrtJ-associated TM-motif-TM protein